MTEPNWTLDEVVADQCGAFDDVVAELEDEQPGPPEFLPVGRQLEVFGDWAGVD